ncbi:MAG: alpha-ribazole phosphatase [Desulfuromonas sp.]|nr:MAG: alpha-ribazole phosphatase [Desulfuromonas sp.]
MKATRIYLVRHGQVEGHEEKRYNGQADVALTPQGQGQYGLLQMRLQKKNISAVYSSDLKRCVEGAQLLAASHGLVPELREELRELHIGDWEGMTWQELQQQYPEQWQARLDDIVHYQVPGGESLAAMSARVIPVIEQIVDAHPGEEVVVVAHGGVNRVILLEAIGAPLERLFHIEQDYGCLNAIDYYPDGCAVVTMLNA